MALLYGLSPAFSEFRNGRECVEFQRRSVTGAIFAIKWEITALWAFRDLSVAYLTRRRQNGFLAGISAFSRVQGFQRLAAQASHRARSGATFPPHLWQRAALGSLGGGWPHWRHVSSPYVRWNCPPQRGQGATSAMAMFIVA